MLTMIANTKRIITVCFLASFALVAVGCGPGTAQINDSNDNLRTLARAVNKYYDDNMKWPEAIADLKPVIGQDDGSGKIGGGKDYAAIVKNPITGDDPGYEYVKPTEARAVKPSEEITVFYQLRGGKRDEKLSVANLDVSIHKVGEAKP